MKILKKLCAIGTLSVVLATSIPATTYFGENITTVEAATQTIKLNKTKLSLTVGEKFTLKLSGTKSKITWSTSDKTIATVSEGKVTAKKVGKATITATVNKKKYTCEVTIKKDSESQKITVGNLSFKLPKSYKEYNLGAEQDTLKYFTTGKDVLESGIAFYSIETGLKVKDFTDIFSEDGFQELMNEMVFEKTPNLSLSGTDQYKSKAGNVMISEYSYEEDGEEYLTVVYLLIIDNYLIEIVYYGKDNVNKEVSNVAKNICDTLQVNN